MAKEMPEVLFVCVHNAGRSQMAAALVSSAREGRVHVRSAGSDAGRRDQPGRRRRDGRARPRPGEEFPKPLTDEFVRAADVVITMGCGDACPIYPGKRYEDWEVDDPAGQDLDDRAPHPRRHRRARPVADRRALAGVDGACVAAAHRDHDVGGADDLVGERLRELLAHVDADLVDRLDDGGVDLLTGVAACGADVDAALGAELDEPCGHLAAACVVDADEQDLGYVRGHEPLRLRERPQTLAREAMSEDGDEDIDLARSEQFDRLGDVPLDRFLREDPGELVGERGCGLPDVILGHGVKHLAHRCLLAIRFSSIRRRPRPERRGGPCARAPASSPP